mgnify:CR=1 FL=1
MTHQETGLTFRQSVDHMVDRAIHTMQMNPDIAGVIIQLPTMPPTLFQATASTLTPTAAKPTIAPKIIPMATTNKPVVIITGASSGIGESTARLFGLRGWHVIVVARRRGRRRFFSRRGIALFRFTRRYPSGYIRRGIFD